MHTTGRGRGWGGRGRGREPEAVGIAVVDLLTEGGLLRIVHSYFLLSCHRATHEFGNGTHTGVKNPIASDLYTVIEGTLYGTSFRRLKVHGNSAPPCIPGPALPPIAGRKLTASNGASRGCVRLGGCP